MKRPLGLLPLLILILLASPASIQAGKGLRITSPTLKNPVTFDGKWSSGDEWKDGVGFDCGGYGWIALKDDHDFLYLLVDYTRDFDATAGDFAWIVWDQKNDGGGKPRSDDYNLLMSYEAESSYELSVYQGTGTDWDWENPIAASSLGVVGASSTDATSDPRSKASHVAYEFRLPRLILDNSTVITSIGFYAGAQNAVSDVWIGLPRGGDYRIPDSWAQLTFSVPVAVHANRTAETTATTGVTQAITTTKEQNYSTGTETFSATITAITTVTQTGVANTLFGPLSGSGALLLVAVAVLVPVTYIVVRRRRELVSYLKRDRYVEYLARLEELRSRGDISEETYLKLKEEYWKKFGK